MPRLASPHPSEVTTLLSQVPPQSPLAVEEYTAANPAPIPWKQFIPILFLRVVDATCYIVLFPFITEYITSIPGVPPERIGLYAGMAEGSLMVTEALLATTWAKVGDRWGRKRCLVWGTVVVTSCMGMVGFGKSVWWIIFWRAMIGLTPGAVLSKTVAAELCHPTNRARIFSIHGPSFSVGVMVGSLLGGQLAHPSGRVPWWLGGELEVWREWPYAMPCLAATLLGYIASVVCYFMYDENHPSAYNASADGVEKRTTGNTFLAVLKIPHFMLILIVFWGFQLSSFAYEGLFTVYTYTPIPRGGLGLPVKSIGYVSCFSALLYICLSPVLVPLFERTIGIKRALLLANGIMPVAALVIPLAQWAARGDAEAGGVNGGAGTATWVVLGLQLVMKNINYLAWPLNDHLIYGSLSDYPELIASGGAVTLITGATGRAVGPAIAGWVYSISTQFPVASFGRQLSWLVLLAICLPPVIMTRFLPDDRAARQKDLGEEEFGEGQSEIGEGSVRARQEVTTLGEDKESCGKGDKGRKEGRDSDGEGDCDGEAAGGEGLVIDAGVVGYGATAGGTSGALRG
ncbi:hypothetical protein IAT38_006477 [Cryptococcus sp. DSM 104549]